MKWKEADFNSALSRQMSGVPAVLIYGPDAGQVDEMADRAVEKLGIDSLNLFVVDSNELATKTDQLFAEGCTSSMFGGRRMIWISSAGDSDAPLIRELVQHPSLDAFVVITAGDLRAGGGLRKLFEDDAKLAALPCYADDANSIARVVREGLFAAGIKQIDPDAMQYMCGRLGADRGVTRRFLEVLALYVDDTKIVSLDAVEKCLPDNGAASMDEFLYSLTAGHIAQAARAIDRVFTDGAEPVMLVRVLDSHFKKLLSAVSGGQYIKPFWKYTSQWEAATKIWPESEIVAVMQRLNELERHTKSTGYPAELLLRDFALKLSVRAAKFAIKARRR